MRLPPVYQSVYQMVDLVCLILTLPAKVVSADQVQRMIEAMYTYEVKVRGTTYLWGSKGITRNFAWPLLLCIRNDYTGDQLSFGTETTTDEDQTIYGALNPGEAYTVSLLGLRGVFAQCE